MGANCERHCIGSGRAGSTAVLRICKGDFSGFAYSYLNGALGVEAGTRGGLIAPFLQREDENHVLLGYLWSDAEFHDPAVIGAIKGHPDSDALVRMMA